MNQLLICSTRCLSDHQFNIVDQYVDEKTKKNYITIIHKNIQKRIQILRNLKLIRQKVEELITATTELVEKTRSKQDITSTMISNFNELTKLLKEMSKTI